MRSLGSRGASPVGPVIRSKVVPAPISAELIERPRLIEQLSDEARVQLVVAMPGFGKTILVRQWVDSIAVPVGWVSLDLLDEDPSSFWVHVLVALRDALPGIVDEPLELLVERGVEDRTFLAALIAGLESTPREVVLVLDGVPARLDHGVAEALALLVERAGHRLRLTMTARSTPPLPLGRWRSWEWLREVREDELALSDEEAVTIADMVDARSSPPSDAIELNRRVGGWPLGLHMALLARRGAPGLGPAGIAGSDPVVPSYLVADVLDALGDRERHVAMSLSVLEWFDPELSEALLGPDVDVVSELLRQGLFLTVVDGRSGAMRFHPLFRELMELELGARDPHRRVDLHRRASVAWRDRGDLMAAYHHLAAIGESDHAHELIVGPAWSLVDSGDLPALRQFAQQLPATHNIDDPGLALDLAVVALFSDGAVAARRWCERAAMLLERPQPGSGCPPDEFAVFLIRLRELRCGIALFDADLDTALTELAAHEGVDSRRSPGLFGERFPIIAARVLLAARRLDEAESWIRAAERIAGPDIVAAATVPTLRGWHDWLTGDLTGSTAQLDAALAWVDEHRVDVHHLGFDTLISTAWARLGAGDLDGAAAIARRACDAAETLDTAWCHLQAGYLMSRVAVVRGDPRRALDVCDDLRARIDFGACWPYAQRILAVEIDAFAALGRHADVRRLIDALEPGPRRQLCLARFAGAGREDIDVVLAGHDAWPATERLHAEILVAVRRAASDPGAVRTLVAEAAATGWVLPLLELRSSVESVVPPSELARIHPQLGSTFARVDPPTCVDRAVTVALTPRELSLVRLLPTHLTYAAMGGQLFLSVNTVKLYLKSVYRKLGASTRDEAVTAAREAGLL